VKDKMTELFINRLTEVNGEYVQINSKQELAILLVKFLKKNRLRSLAISRGVFSDDDKKIISNDADILIDFDLDSKMSNSEVVDLVGNSDIGVSIAQALISDTGSVVLRSQYHGDRLCSTLPEVNVIIWDDRIMYKNSAEFYADISPDLTYTLITGPSRTADIEKTLVLGAHGPRRLIVFGR